MEGYIIQDLKPNNNKVISAIVQRLTKRWKCDASYIMQHFLEPSFQEGIFPYVFIVTVNGEYAGNIFLVLEKNGYLSIDNQPWITALYVKKKFRNMGLGKGLIQVAKEKAKLMGYDSLYLDTASASKYYNHIGGRDVIGKAYRKWGNRDVVVMKTML